MKFDDERSETSGNEVDRTLFDIQNLLLTHQISPDGRYQFTTESFKYLSNSVIFYNDIYGDNEPQAKFNGDSRYENTFEFSIELLPVTDFDGGAKATTSGAYATDGSKNDYKIALNKFVLMDSVVTAGSVLSQLNIEFYDTNGQLKHTATMNIAVTFLTTKTILRLSTYGWVSAQYLQQYFSDYFLLKIDKVIREVD